MVLLSFLLLGFVAYISYFIIQKGVAVVDTLMARGGRGLGVTPSNFILFRLFWSDSIKKYLSFLGPALIVNLFVPEIEGLSQNLISWVQQSVLVFIVILLLLVVNRVLSNITYLPQVEALPNYLGIKVVLEASKVLLYFITGILVVAYFTKQSLFSVMSAMGAMTAVLLLVFRDSILGLASGIQISANKMLRIGDWIEIPACGVDGTVLEIRLTTVKVRNWDNSVVNLPAHNLVQNSFKNWQGMIGTGVRRIKRSMFLDATGIRFLTPEELKKTPEYLHTDSTLTKKPKPLRSKKNTQNTKNVNNAPHRITNAELFRAYVSHYLHHHPQIHQDHTLLVRQLQAGPKGIPLEIYAFTRTTDWGEYEDTQTEIFEHLYAQAGEFGLEVFQDPRGRDFAEIGKVSR